MAEMLTQTRKQTGTRRRYAALDGIRGLAILNMILYHGAWDLVYLFGVDFPWYRSQGAYIWQQGICWTFILLSGFCQGLGKSRWQRGLTVFAAGLVITGVTLIAMPESRVLFGVLTLLGSCMLLMVPLERVLSRISPGLGLLGSAVLFALTRNVNRGCLGFEALKLWKLPGSWYRNLATAYLGLPAEEFYSTDYFSLIPWLFLFLAGYFLCRSLSRAGRLSCLESGRLKPLEFLGRHSLIIYMLHQPLLYLLCMVLFG